MIRAYLIFGVVMAMLIAPISAKAADSCQATTATNQEHVAADRAYTGTGCTFPGYYAVGSEEYIGLTGGRQTTLFTVDDGLSYQQGNCPPLQGNDEDSDGYTAEEDCNDAAPDIHPQAEEICGDGIDQNCDGSDPQCPDCQEWSTSNAEHATAGRAYTVVTNSGCNEIVSYYVVGSDEPLGTSDSAVTTLNSKDGGRSYDSGSCPDSGLEDKDNDGYVSDQDCDEDNPLIHPGAMDFCGDGIDQDCNGADATCLPPPSCITSLDSWKVAYTPKNSNCRTCHTTCTPGGASGRHGCIEGEDWGEMSCKGCHSTIHGS